MSEIEPQHRYWSTEEQRWIYPGEVRLPQPAGVLTDGGAGVRMVVYLPEGTDIYIAEQVRHAVLEERERCARVCDQYAQERDQNSAGAEVCAAAIRRGSV